MKTKIFFLVMSLLIFSMSFAQTTLDDNPPFSTPGKLEPNYIPVSIHNLFFFGIYITVILILIGCLVVAVEVKEIQRKNNKIESVVY